MKKYALALLLAVLVVMTGMTLRRSVVGASPSNVQVQKLVAIGADPVPLPPQLSIGADPVPLPPGRTIGADPVPLPPKASIGADPVPLPPGSHKRAL
ncbi:MAG: hypothetical protein LAP13_09995 [Acidobacteriia bacterium]|nr:hypothetical protein [Terriglobia bacterium]